MIPKTIHYCWFGNNEKNELILKCIESWKKYLPDYEIIEWNEKNYDVNCNLYIKQAHESKKWAFVSDFVRLDVLYKYGGIYFDTDVEVIKNIDTFLIYEGFTGIESNMWPSTAIFASEPKNQVIKLILDYYNNKQFIINGNFDLTPNTQFIAKIFLDNYNIILDGKQQTIVNSNFIIFPTDYFCPKNYGENSINITENTYTIHHFNGSWL